MCIPAILGKVSHGSLKGPDKKETQKNFDKIGMKLFIPVLSMGGCALLFGLFTNISALVGTAFGVILAMILLKCWNKENTLKVFFSDSERFLSMMGPLSLLPLLLTVLGVVFTKAGIGDIISTVVMRFIPEGNVNLGIIVYAVGMMIFTMIMGNAFAAINVMTIGVGVPLVLKYGANPAVITMLALTCGNCGTLLTPMAANFNIVPAAILEMNNKYGVIKNQIIPAILLLIFQIVVMIICK